MDAGAERSHLNFSLKLRSTGNGFIQIYAGNSDGRRSGTVLFLGESEYEQLKNIMGKAEQAVQDLRQSGRMRKMAFLS
jgi:hypothetical protein